MYNVRSDEPKYAFLWDKETKQTNCYGHDIEKSQEDSLLRNQSLNINGDDGVGENPNRYKQHGFYFNADNCIGCHACESACSEKNEVPSHLAFRSVGFVEGGSYPDYQRLNISMACNHCDDPVCLKGCPTRAYTKFAEYGAVLQDPDICFGCGYCTWVCPYNAPQLDPVKGQVSKCNMCVDRLEVGLKPACVAACLGNALDFGVVENIPENREQAKVSIPGFPTNEITHPNVRFQQTKNTQRDMVRVDGMPVKYHKQEDGNFKSTLDSKKHSAEKHWGIKKLLQSHENAHAIFTLCAQAVFGATMWLVFSDVFNFIPVSEAVSGLDSVTILLVLVMLIGYGLFKLSMHLGKPQFFYRGFYNLKFSPVSREIAGVSLFFTGLLMMLVVELTGLDLFSNIAYAVTVFGFLFGSYYMYKLYRIPARPFWNHWQTGSAFYGTAISLGSMLLGALLIILTGEVALISTFSAIALVGIIIESIGYIFHPVELKKTGEGQASHFEQTTTYGKTYTMRNMLLALNIICLPILVYLQDASLYFALLSVMLISSYLGRILFYAVVTPTTMPGAFFWKNNKFKEHAIETGLSDMPQMGVMAERHHKFDIGLLMDTIKQTTVKSAVSQIKAILRGG
ncbi:MAG: dimethyl sulfoxide reductase anchor subunit [Candidatus Thioglobus sp.]|uniref:DmsC/YnfH family molybdoenzyme membrane anchor subunit n=1 Tax=Candidatus Thioglobus sp. TaxID=2026721 RepID=UPI002609F444|nr:DmsC/YnfH family molybdoenzyme membrane anchor subunit [Candidatus Thioglobus sp.]MDC9727149.1 dimethyl sulfoxide reductase anchor subunit [Candidatus Thioglobus sp.]